MCKCFNSATLRSAVARAVCTAALLMATLVSSAEAGPLAYMTGTTNPWGSTSNDAAMNTAFGAGTWDKFNGFNASVLTAGYDFIFFDGGDGVSGQFESFVNSNRSALENYVANGGALLLNAARWSYGDLNLGFGVTLRAGGSGYGYATTAAQPIVNGPNGSAGTSWTGNNFSHDYLTGAGMNTLIIDAYNRTILSDMNYGAGYVMFGGLTTPNFHNPDPQADNLRANMLDYAALQGGQPVPTPEPGTLMLLGSGALSLVAKARRRKKQASTV